MYVWKTLPSPPVYHEQRTEILRLSPDEGVTNVTCVQKEWQQRREASSHIHESD